MSSPTTDLQLPEGAWQPIETAPRDGTHILAILHREAIADMDGIRRAPFSEIREIWWKPYAQFGMQLPWHAGDPFDAHDGMAPDHMGEAVPVAWMPISGMTLAQKRLIEFRREIERIRNDYIPSNDREAPLALSEMREALATAFDRAIDAAGGSNGE